MREYKPGAFGIILVHPYLTSQILDYQPANGQSQPRTLGIFIQFLETFKYLFTLIGRNTATEFTKEAFFMLCDECHKHEASIYVTEITSQGQIEHHLCEFCATKLGLLAEKQNVFSINDFLSGIFNHEPKTTKHSDTNNLKKPLICPSCHMSYQDFTRTGKIGCSDCYKTFALALEPLLRRIHGSSTHIGKIPNRAGGTLSLKQEILNLRKQITKYVEAEEYEQAAVLRDRIKVLENQLHAKQNLDKGVDQNA